MKLPTKTTQLLSLDIAEVCKMATFPLTLLDVLNGDQYPSSIGWGPNGSVWINPKSFQQEVLTIHFPGVRKFASFTRKMNRYGFKRIVQANKQTDGIFHYQHEIFRQGISMDIANTIHIQKKGSTASIKLSNHPKKSRMMQPPIVPMRQGVASVEVDTAAAVKELLLRQRCNMIRAHAAFAPLAEQRLILNPSVRFNGNNRTVVPAYLSDRRVLPLKHFFVQVSNENPSGSTPRMLPVQWSLPRTTANGFLPLTKYS